jgi:serine/threonine protein phosphatase PrpC
VLQAWGTTDAGTVRPANEDCFAIDETLQLCVVADGMGGHNAGEIAAHTAVASVVDVVRDRTALGWPFGFDPSLSEAGNLIRTAIYLAHMHVLEIAGSSAAYAGMGTTLVAALVVDGRLSVGHVGDSRLYRLSGGRLRQLTGDDSWMATMMAGDPRADAALLQFHPLRHALTNVVGTRRRTQVHVVEEPLAAGDRLLLSTDGVHGVLDDRRLEGLLLESRHLPAASADLVRAALTRGSCDNCTAIVAQYHPTLN